MKKKFGMVIGNPPYNEETIEGGVAVTLYDHNKTFEPIGTFIPFAELKTIHQKVVVDNPAFRPLSDIISGRTPYLFTSKLHEDFFRRGVKVK